MTRVLLEAIKRIRKEMEKCDEGTKERIQLNSLYEELVGMGIIDKLELGEIEREIAEKYYYEGISLEKMRSEEKYNHGSFGASLKMIERMINKHRYLDM